MKAASRPMGTLLRLLLQLLPFDFRSAFRASEESVAGDKVELKVDIAAHGKVRSGNLALLTAVPENSFVSVLRHKGSVGLWFGPLTEPLNCRTAGFVKPLPHVRVFATST
jgi:hypothetical protein